MKRWAVILLIVLIGSGFSVFAQNPDNIQPFTINDKVFAAENSTPCTTDVEITAVEGGNLIVKPKSIQISSAKMRIWGNGALHTWIGKLTYKGFRFDSSPDDPLQFMTVKNKGYVYQKGKGSVTFPNGKTVMLPNEDTVAAGEDRPLNDRFLTKTIDFSCKEQGFLESNQYKIGDGEFWFTGNQKPGCLVRCMNEKISPDFTVQVRARLDEGKGPFGFGLLLRQKGKSCYMFKIDGKGGYQFIKYSDGRGNALIDWQRTIIIKPGYNLLKATCVGRSIKCFINDQLVIDIVNDPPGDQKIEVGITADNRVNCRFDDFEVTTNVQSSNTTPNAQTEKVNQKKSSSKFRVIGRVVDNQGKPVVDATINITEVDESGKSYIRIIPKEENGEQFWVVVPGHATTDRNGMFNVIIDRAEFENTAKRQIGLSYVPQIIGAESSPLQNKEGAMIVVVVDDAATIIDFRKIVGDIILD